uniref:uncharacterized protein LOC120343807 isoform X1 n=1 Tax=Styela clava TaxID=7725 RepID=UPI00193A2F78|nr:uncharacterized protein LOC120343807 isoform X1 [Styela clava]
MTSLHSRRKSKMASSQVSSFVDGDDQDHREGIFDQFSEDSSPEMYYYTVYSSSDSEGNLTIQDVTREKFGSDVKELTGEENGEMEDDSEVTKQRYGFRTRRLKRQRDDEINTAFYTNSSDESANEGFGYLMSSDDETYDIASDNWAFVRGAKKKTNSETKKKSEEAKKKNEGSPKMKPKTKSKPNLLKIKIKAAFTGKKSKSKKDQTSTVMAPKKDEKLPKVEKVGSDASPEKIPKISPKRKLPIKARFKSANLMSSFTTEKSPPPIPAAVTPVSSFPKKSPNRIRCGYNPKAPKIPELRHIRRRQLRQNPKRVLSADSNALDDGTSSSDDETAEEITKTMRRTSLYSLRASSRGGTKRKVSKSLDVDERFNNSSTTAKSTDNILTTKTSPRKRGLKLVIRRDSLDQNIPKTPLDNDSKAEQTSSKRVSENNQTVPVSSTTADKTRDVTAKQNLSPKMIPKVVLERSPKMTGSAYTNTPESTAHDKKNGDESNLCKTQEILAMQDVPAEAASQSSAADKDIDCSVTSKTVDDEIIKKKKPRKKKKKDRGRAGISAGTEDTLDGEDTAMRLAMELPNHNWLVKHLIKENKIKAEDDKPLNNNQIQESNAGEQSAGLEPATNPSIPTTVKDQYKVGNSAEGGGLKNNDPANNSDPDKSRDVDSQTNSENLKPASTGVKGSFMVGIVKPFDHLIKMSPTNLEACRGETSPPPLCIIDEEESYNDNSNGDATLGPAVEQCVNKNSAVSSSCSDLLAPSCIDSLTVGNATGKQSSHGNIDKATKDCITTKGCNIPMDIVGHHHKTCQVYTTMPVRNGNENSASSHKEMPSDLKNAIHNIKNNAEVINFTSGLTYNIKKSVNEQSNDDVAVDENPETDHDIKISNCVSLALDLRKTTIENPATDNQPLDLSLKSTNSQLSPKILDLSVKKAIENIQNQTSSSHEKAANLSVSKIVSKKEEQPAQVQITKPVQEQVIIIDDDVTSPSESASEKPNQHPPAGISRNTVLKRPESTKSDDGPPVKRCASLDSTNPQGNLFSSSPKRVRDVRRSLDEVKRTRIEDNLSPKNVVNRNKILQYKTDHPPALKQTVNGPGGSVIHYNNAVHSSPKSRKDGSWASGLELRPGIPTLPSHLPPVPPSKKIEATTLPPRQAVPASHYTPGVNRNTHNSQSNSQIPIPANSAQKLNSQFHTKKQVSGIPNMTPQQLVAQAYDQYDINHLGPYIKQQQNEIDKKIKELERLKNALIKVQHEKPAKASPTHTVVCSSSFPIPIPRQIPSNQKSLPPKHHPFPYAKNENFHQGHPRQLQPSQISPPRIQHASSKPSHMMPQYRQSIPLTTQFGQFPPQYMRSRPAQQQPPIQQMRSPLYGQRPVGYPQYQARVPSPQQALNRPPGYGPSQVFSSNASLTATAAPANHMFRAPQQIQHQTVRQAPQQIQHQTVRQAPQQIQHQTVRQAPQQIQHQTVRQRHPGQVVSKPTQPVYRNGGLTINGGETKTKLDEPIIIEDDINSNLKLISSNTPVSHVTRVDALKARRSHSFHPPLSKNRTNPQQTPKQWMSSAMSQMTAARFSRDSSHPSIPEAVGEVCVKCREKAFFLCSGCRKVWYCSKKCQLSDWTTHSSKCNG